MHKNANDYLQKNMIVVMIFSVKLCCKFCFAELKLLIIAISH